MTNMPTTLTSVEKAMYKAGYNFMKTLGKTEEEAHEKGMYEVARLAKIRKNSKPEVWVNLKTGKKITANY
jgi:hypothetical protein